MNKNLQLNSYGLINLHKVNKIALCFLSWVFGFYKVSKIGGQDSHDRQYKKLCVIAWHWEDFWSHNFFSFGGNIPGFNMDSIHFSIRLKYHRDRLKGTCFLGR